MSHSRNNDSLHNGKSTQTYRSGRVTLARLLGIHSRSLNGFRQPWVAASGFDNLGWPPPRECPSNRNQLSPQAGPWERRNLSQWGEGANGYCNVDTRGDNNPYLVLQVVAPDEDLSPLHARGLSLASRCRGSPTPVVIVIDPTNSTCRFVLVGCLRIRIHCP